jgi:MFS transporter, FSR family, fosmidomycin resistance protein
VRELYRNRLFVSVVIGHFGVDVLNSIGPVLLAVLAAPLALSNARIGFALTMYTFASSLLQPLFGWLADRVRGRSVVWAGVGAAWMVVCFGAVALTQSWTWLLPFFLLAAIGSAIFHPIGTANAAAAYPARAATATAIFFFCGQIGLAAGPVIGGLLFGWSGSFGVLLLGIGALLGATLMLLAPAPAPATAKAARRAATAVKATTFAIAAFVLLVAVRSSIQATYAAFLPKLFADRGWDPALFGALAGAFMFAAAIGNLLSGGIADSYGMRLATVIPLLLGVPAGLLCLWAPTPATAFVASALTGLFVGGQHSVLVVHAQRLLPTGRSFASGLILGFTFASGGVGTWIGGIAADSVGLLTVMQIVTLLGLPCALLALTLPGRARQERAVAIAEPAASQP